MYEWLDARNIDAAYLVNDSDVRYLTGMPYGSVLLLFRRGTSVLLPWDEILARKVADAEEILPYTDYERNLIKAVPAVLEQKGVGPGSRIEVPAATEVPVHGRIKAALPGIEILCGDDGIDSCVRSHRMIKDESELTALRRAAEITNAVFGSIEAAVTEEEELTELDIALLIERESRRMGADGTGFDTIVAGPARSYGIHAFPGYTAAPFATPGLSIIDFGVKFNGYTSDITVTVARGGMTRRQELMIGLVQEAYELSMGMIGPGVKTHEIAQAVDRHFAARGFTMPHGLGHGVGLDVHEAPWVRSRGSDSSEIRAGMIFTIEPGLYDEQEGGVRLENDVLVTDEGPQIITTSRILRIP